MFIDEIRALRTALQDLDALGIGRGVYKSRDFEDGFAKPDHFSSSVALYFGSYKILTDLEDVDYLEALYFGQDEPTSQDHVMNFIIDMLTHRARMLKRGSKRIIISLGDDCLPRTIATKWGLKRPKVLGERTCPFDLAVHPTNSVGDILRNRFATYILDKDIAFNSDLGHPINNRYQILWNHEGDREFSEENFRKLRELYNRRIKNFFEMICEGPSLAVIHLSKKADPATINTIATELGEISDGQAVLAVVDTSGSANYSEKMYIYGRTKVFQRNFPLPYSWYLWWFHEHFTLPEGYKWERTIVDWLNELVSKGTEV